MSFGEYHSRTALIKSAQKIFTLSIHVEVGVLWVVSISRLTSRVVVIRVVTMKLAPSLLSPRYSVVIGGIHAAKPASS